MTEFKVVIIGYGPHIGQVIQLVQLSGYQPMVVEIDPHAPLETLDRYLNEKLRITHGGDHYLLIGSATNPHGDFDFSALLKLLKPLSVNLRHPIVLSDLFPLDLRDRVVCCGFPGSGNGLLQAVVETVLALETKSNPMDEQTRFMGAYQADYLTIIDRHLREFGRSRGLTNVAFATHLERTVSVVLSSPPQKDFWGRKTDLPDFLMLYGLPMRNYISEKIHKTHEKYGDKLQRMSGFGAKTILAVRNPLDNIISLANKASSRGINLLENRFLFLHTAKSLIKYYQSFTPAITSGKVMAIKYEDLFYSFECAVRQIANSLGQDVASDQLAIIKGDLLNVPLKNAGKRHLWKPGTGKWKEYMRPSHIEMLKQIGLDQIAKDIGYSFPDKSQESRGKRLPITILGLGGHGLFFTDGLDVVDDYIAHVRHLEKLHHNGCLWLSNSADIISSVSSFFKESLFLDLVASGLPSESLESALRLRLYNN